MCASLLSDASVPDINNYNIIGISSDYVVPDVNYFVAVDASNGDVIVTLPDEKEKSGSQVVVKKIDLSSNKVTIKSNLHQIDKSTEKTISNPNTSITFICDGLDWWVI